MKYVKQENDVKYRLVDLNSAKTGDFLPFDRETIDFSGKKVLEVLRSDQSTELFYDGTVTKIGVFPVVVDGKSYFRFSPPSVTFPPQRLWLKKSDGTGIAYKVPNSFTRQDEERMLYVPGGVKGLVLFGDEYFEKAYSISMN